MSYVTVEELEDEKVREAVRRLRKTQAHKAAENVSAAVSEVTEKAIQVGCEALPYIIAGVNAGIVAYTCAEPLLKQGVQLYTYYKFLRVFI